MNVKKKKFEMFKLIKLIFFKLFLLIWYCDLMNNLEMECEILLEKDVIKNGKRKRIEDNFGGSWK